MRVRCQVPVVKFDLIALMRQACVCKCGDCGRYVISEYLRVPPNFILTAIFRCKIAIKWESHVRFGVAINSLIKSRLKPRDKIASVKGPLA